MSGKVFLIENFAALKFSWNFSVDFSSQVRSRKFDSEIWMCNPKRVAFPTKFRVGGDVLTVFSSLQWNSELAFCFPFEKIFKGFYVCARVVEKNVEKSLSQILIACYEGRNIRVGLKTSHFQL